MDLKASLTLSSQDKLFANPRRIALLQQIAITGSISQGAKLAGISYKAAWDAVNDMNVAFSHKVVSSEKGGKGGGGAKLTPFGLRLLQVYSITEQVQNMALDALLDDAVGMDNLLELMAHFSLKTSARNQLTGTICAIHRQDLNDQIEVQLSSGQMVTAVVTHASSQRLGLALNKSVLLLFKAPAVKISATPIVECGHNQIEGQLQHINYLGDKVELALQIGTNSQVHALMSQSALDGMPLSLGETYYASFDAGQTIVACMD